MAATQSPDYAKQHGHIHDKLNPNWSYTPIYINKMEVVEELVKKYHPHQGKILDAGCAEGVQVKKYKDKGFDIIGLDASYSSESVIQASITEMPFEAKRFSTVLCLDVLEHLQYADQPLALSEIKRVLKPDGHLIFCIPNMAHFTARLKLMFRGKLLRTATIEHHPGDRTAHEFRQILATAGFEIVETRGVFPTIPPIYRQVMRRPAQSVELLRFLRKLPVPPDWCFQVLFVCKIQTN